MTLETELQRRKMIQDVIDLLVHPDPIQRERNKIALDNFIQKRQRAYHKDSECTISIRIKEHDEFNAFK